MGGKNKRGRGGGGEQRGAGHPEGQQRAQGHPEGQQRAQGHPEGQQRAQGHPEGQQRAQGHPEGQQRAQGHPEGQQRAQGHPEGQQRAQGHPEGQQRAQGQQQPFRAQQQQGSAQGQRQEPFPRQQGGPGVGRVMRGQGRGQPFGRGQRPAGSQGEVGPQGGLQQSFATMSVGEARPFPQHQPPRSHQQKPVPAQPTAQQEKQKPAHQQPTSQQQVPAQSQQMPAQQRASQPVQWKFEVKTRTTQGTQGRRTQVETNHLPIKYTPRSKSQLVYHYDIKFEPERPKRLYRAAFLEFKKIACGNQHPAFDGKANVYSYGLLPFQENHSCEVTVGDPEREKPFTFVVTVQVAEKPLDFSLLQNFFQNRQSITVPREVMQALDVVMREASWDPRYIKVGRSYFAQPLPGQVVDLGNGVEAWVGSFQSAVLGWKPFLNFDVAHKGFPKHQSCLQLMQDLYGRQNRQYGRQDDRQYGQAEFNEAEIMRQFQQDRFGLLQNYIKGLKIEYIIPGQPNSKRTLRVNGVRESASRLSFTMEDANGKEKRTTVQAFFQQERNYRLRYPELPCLWVGSREKNVCLPLELCSVPGNQVTMKKMDETQTANMIKVAATPAYIRKQKIMEGFRKLGINNNPSMQEFGIQVSERMEQVDARVLDAPDLVYNQCRPARVERGVWRATSKFFAPADARNWVILNLERFTRDEQIRDFVRLLQQESQKMGMNLGEYGGCSNSDSSPKSIEIKLSGLRNCDLVIVIVPDRGTTYATVKQKAELEFGILTQCVKSFTVGRKMNPATANNILLKINAKLNGINHTLHQNSRPACFDRPVIIMGADVTHPSPDSKGVPSIAAVTASHDPQALFMYNIECRLQPPRMEIIEDLQNIVQKQLKFFHEKTKGQKPGRIIFYRDGVGDGQFPEVLRKEMTAIRKACLSINENYRPAVTFLVVQKRHHTRFFPTRREDEDGKNKNVPPGLVVDTMITSPKEMDFYLVSHQSIQGTSRPTKYCVLHDDANMSEDEVEQLTYYLCHLFSRCNRSVSYPAPTYYAHLAAFRAKAYIEGKTIDLDNLKTVQERLCTINEIFSKKSPMFFV